jgi:homoserine O-acetyltransferase
MGAQQTYEWAVRFPDKVLRAAPIAGTARNTPHDFLFTETLNEAIWSDPAWNNGFYNDSSEVREGLARQAHLWSVMGFSTEFFKQEHWRKLGFTSLDDFQIAFMEGYFGPMDPNDLLCMAWKWQRGDVSRHTGGDLAAALARITAKTYVMPIDEDMFFPPRDCEPEQKLIEGSELQVIQSISGHLGLFGLEPTFMEQIDRILGQLLGTKV